MASRYKFSDEEIKSIEQAHKGNKDKRAEARLKALELRAKGAEASEVAEATGFHAAYVTQLVAKYRDNSQLYHPLVAVLVSVLVLWEEMTLP